MSLPFFRKKQDSKIQETNCQVISYSAIASSDVGAVRENNEDKVLFIKPNEKDILLSKGVLGIVADGMGGHNHGEIASQMAVDVVCETYYNSKEKITKALRIAFQTANNEITVRASQSEALSGMGTTCTAVVIKGKDLFLAHAGDSRAYIVNKKSISKISKDHTYVQHLLDHGIIKQKQVQNHPEKNVVTKSLGPNQDVDPDIMHFPEILGEEDLIFLCSDGLYEYIKDEEIQEILINNKLAKAAEVLTSKAIERGGHDNISVLIIANSSKVDPVARSKSKVIA